MRRPRWVTTRVSPRGTISTHAWSFTRRTATVMRARRTTKPPRAATIMRPRAMRADQAMRLAERVKLTSTRPMAKAAERAPWTPQIRPATTTRTGRTGSVRRTMSATTCHSTGAPRSGFGSSRGRVSAASATTAFSAIGRRVVRGSGPVAVGPRPSRLEGLHAVDVAVPHAEEESDHRHQHEDGSEDGDQSEPAVDGVAHGPEDDGGHGQLEGPGKAVAEAAVEVGLGTAWTGGGRAHGRRLTP